MTGAGMTGSGRSGNGRAAAGGRALRVGVTGGIGSGKSTVCQLFARLGAHVYDSDTRARELMNGDGGIKRAIVALLGPDAYRGLALDNAYVAAKVFNDKMLLASLNAIVHPAVAMDFEAWALPFTGSSGSDGRPVSSYIVLESAILFESGFDRFVDRVVSVSAPVEVRLERVLSRGSGLSREEMTRRMANQLSDADRAARAWRTIDNSGSQDELATQVRLLHADLTAHI
jgi:dephospho-CoA kinase